jgi:hypothetical protein
MHGEDVLKSGHCKDRTNGDKVMATLTKINHDDGKWTELPQHRVDRQDFVSEVLNLQILLAGIISI